MSGGVILAAAEMRDAFRYRPEGQSGYEHLLRKVRQVCAAVDAMESAEADPWCGTDFALCACESDRARLAAIVAQWGPIVDFACETHRRGLDVADLDDVGVAERQRRWDDLHSAQVALREAIVVEVARRADEMASRRE